MTPQIINFPEKKLVGKRMEMSFANNRTGELWRSFMPRKNEIAQAIGTDLYSLQRYEEGFFDPFNPQAIFEKWAAMEVGDFGNTPEGMDTLALPGGLYAVFHYKGPANDAKEIFRYILGVWLPDSGYQLDHRPHFEILGEKYKNNDPDSEEDIYIPIKSL
jgi:AraC family transcriptional regulator